jgi:excisionase family DNA binding protein
MTKKTKKNDKENKARKEMPQGLSGKKANVLRDWQRYVRKETQRIARGEELLKPVEATKPPIPKGPAQKKTRKKENTKPVAQATPHSMTTEDLEPIEEITEFDQDINTLMSDSGVEIDDDLRDWVEPIVTAKPQAPPVAKPKAKPSKKDKQSKSDTLELFGEQLEKARRKKKSPRKTRENLIENLLDPIITLDEAAVILNVCKTTVRRYTNAGKIECLRTPGNQRRFRLSTVLEFLEDREGRKTSRIAD